MHNGLDEIKKDSHAKVPVAISPQAVILSGLIKWARSVRSALAWESFSKSQSAARSRASNWAYANSFLWIYNDQVTPETLCSCQVQIGKNQDSKFLWSLKIHWYFSQLGWLQADVPTKFCSWICISHWPSMSGEPVHRSPEAPYDPKWARQRTPGGEKSLLGEWGELELRQHAALPHWFISSVSIKLHGDQQKV